jgi:fimbrial isopeptide formation D2 family protein
MRKDNFTGFVHMKPSKEKRIKRERSRIVSLAMAVLIACSTIVQGAAMEKDASNGINQAGNNISQEAAAASIMDSFDNASDMVTSDQGSMIEGLYCVDNEATGINALREILAVNPDDEGVIQLMERLSGASVSSGTGTPAADDVNPALDSETSSDQAVIYEADAGEQHSAVYQVEPAYEAAAADESASVALGLHETDGEGQPASEEEPEAGGQPEVEGQSASEERPEAGKKQKAEEEAQPETGEKPGKEADEENEDGKVETTASRGVSDTAALPEDDKVSVKEKPRLQGVKAQASRKNVQLTGTKDSEDRQHGEPLAFVPADTKEKSMAYVSGFVLTGLRDGAGDWDDHTDLNGYDSSDSNKVVRTQDDITYYMSYSTALNDAYRYKTISGAKLYLQYSLPVASSKAQFNLEAMPWLKGNGSGGKPVVTTANGGNTQILTGYRDLPDNSDEYGSYDVPGAGTVNCVIHVLNMDTGAVIQPVFKAWIEAKSNTAAPSYAVTASAGTKINDTKVTVSVGAHMNMTIEADKTTLASYGSYTGLSKTGVNTTFSGRLKGFNYTIKIGKMNGSMKGTAPLKAGSRIKVNFKIEGSAVNDPAGTDVALWAVKTKGNDANDALGHTYTEHPGLEQYYTSTDTGLGHAGSATVSGGKYSFVITGFTQRQPGSTASEGLIICSQRMPSSGPNTYHYITSVTMESLDITADDGLGERNISLRESTGSSAYPSASHENAVTPPGSYNVTLHLKSTEADEDGERAFLSGTDTSTANTIGFGKEFFVTANNTNILYDANRRIHSYNQYILWDNRMVEPVIKNGKLDAVIASQSGWSGYYYKENYPIRFITKKDGTAWTDSNEMRTAKLKTYEDLRFYDAYSSVPSGYKICGILVEGRNLREEILGTDNIHGIEFRMKTVNSQSVINKVAMFTHSVDAYTDNKAGVSRASSNGVGTTMPDGDRISYKMNDRTYVRTGWNEDGTIDSSTLTSDNTVFQGNSLLIKGYTCTVDMKHMDGKESRTLDIGTARSVECRVSPKLEGGNLHTTAPSTVLSVSIPDGLEFAGLYAGTNGAPIQLNQSYNSNTFASGARGTFKAEKAAGGLRITFTNAVSDYGLPVFKVKYNFKSGVLKNGMTVDLTSTYTGDSRSLDKLNGNLSSVAIRIVETEASVLKETVNKEKAKNGDLLVYTITYLNTSGNRKTLDISSIRPVNGDIDGTSFIARGSLQYKSATASGSRGSAVSVASTSTGIRATGEVLPGEEATIVVTYLLKDADGGDVIRNRSTQKEENGTIISNSVETVVEEDRGDFSFRKIAADYSWPLAGVKFKITSVKTGETATIVTGSDGRYSSAVNSSSRIWFGNALPDSSKGALPYGTYRLQELAEGPAADSTSMINMTFEIGKTTVDATTGIYELGDLTNTFTLSITKAVDRISNDLGEKHTWTVDAVVPTGISADNGDCSYRLTDVLDNRLNYEGGVQLYMVSDGSSTLLTKTTDYSVEEPASSGGGTLIISMTRNGIRKLEKADSVRLLFMTSINSAATAKTHIPNQASLTFNGFGKSLTLKSNQPYVYTGKISVLKRDSSSGNPLPGVVFRVYRKNDDGSDSLVTRSGKALEATTDNNGRAEFFGLKDGSYRIVETKAAAKHQLLTTKIDVSLGQGDSGIITVDNDQGPSLDAGGRGNRLEISMGLVCMGAALFLLCRHEEKRRTSIEAF